MSKITKNILLKFESASKELVQKNKVKGIPKKGISAAIFSAYLSSVNPAKPGRERCLFLEKVSEYLGYNFTAADWMFHPDKIKQALIDARGTN